MKKSKSSTTTRRRVKLTITAAKRPWHSDGKPIAHPAASDADENSAAVIRKLLNAAADVDLLKLVP